MKTQASSLKRGSLTPSRPVGGGQRAEGEGHRCPPAAGKLLILLILGVLACDLNF